MSAHEPVLAAVALGSNVGKRPEHLEAALDALARLPKTELLGASQLFETAPVRVGDVDPGGAYLNAAALIRTAMSPHKLLAHLLRIEASRGRVREGVPRGAPRPLDLDLLLYGDTLLDQHGLCVPHPRLAQRLFVLRPLAQVAPDLIVSGTGRTVRQLLEALMEQEAAR